MVILNRLRKTRDPKRWQSRAIVRKPGPMGEPANYCNTSVLDEKPGKN